MAAVFWLLISWLYTCEVTARLAAAESGISPPEATGEAGTNAAAAIAAKVAPGFNVRSYRIEGDTLRLCFSGIRRPTAFSSMDKPRMGNMVLTRAKK